MTRHALIALLFAGCAGAASSSAPGPDVTGELPPLGKRAEVFQGAPSNDSLPVTGKSDAIYPAKTELLSTQSPVKNQNARGVCTIFTTTGLMENLYIKAGMKNPSFSEQYLQWSVKVQYGSSADSEGSNISDNLASLAEYGIPTEAIDPYNDVEWDKTNDPDCAPDGTETQQLPTKCWTQGTPTAAMQKAAIYKLQGGAYLNTADIKLHITEKQTAVAVSIPMYYQAWNYPHKTNKTNWDDYYTGIVRFPNATDVKDSDSDPAGHGILIIGWDDNKEFSKVDENDKPILDSSGKPEMEKGFYIFKNSWGTDNFGRTSDIAPGYGYISQAYIAKYASASTATVPTLTP